MLEKAVTVKGFEYSLLGIELKAQTDIAKKKKKEYKKLDRVYNFHRKQGDETINKD